jgi:hypothetical protein
MQVDPERLRLFYPHIRGATAQTISRFFANLPNHPAIAELLTEVALCDVVRCGCFSVASEVRGVFWERLTVEEVVRDVRKYIVGYKVNKANRKKSR